MKFRGITIFVNSEVSKKIAAVVDETENVGRVIVAYFVQTCEVFNEIPE